jgi:hypothetical protein
MSKRRPGSPPSNLKPLTSALFPRLRPYQAEVFRAILSGIRAGDARTLSVQIARQGGKNELSAQLELLLLLQSGSGDLIKIAPSMRPQGLISLNRLWARLRGAMLVPPAVREGNSIGLAGNRLLLLSAGPTANILGHTAGDLMEVDEAQDVDADRFSRDFRPMGASRATATVFYGTPWTETSLLEQMRQRHLELERRDGIRRHFQYGWETVATANPAYLRFALAERARLGDQHPAWRTQYCLETVPGAGLLFTPQQRSLMRGCHPRARFRTQPLLNATIVAGLDVAGEAFAPGRDQDATVLTILAVQHDRSPSPPLPLYGGERQGSGFKPACRVGDAGGSETRPYRTEEQTEPDLLILDHVCWRGAGHEQLLAELTPLIARVWRPLAIAIDTTGIGEGLASAIQARLAGQRAGTQVHRLRISEQLKSRLGFGLLAAAGGRLRCYAGDGSPDFREFWSQIENARAVYKPNQLLGFSVNPADGHDDFLMSLALAIEAATVAQPRVARGRSRETDQPWI